MTATFFISKLEKIVGLQRFTSNERSSPKLMPILRTSEILILGRLKKVEETLGKVYTELKEDYVEK